MYASVKDVDSDIVPRFNKFLVKEGENDIIVDGTHKFIYVFAYTVDEGHGSNRGKAAINIISSGSSKVSDTNKGKWLSHSILVGLAWILVLLFCDISSILVPLGLRSMSTATALKYSFS